MKKLRPAFFFTLFMLVAVSFLSCKKKLEKRADLIEYLNDPGNGLQKVEQTGKTKVALTYRPWQLMEANRPVLAGKKADPYKFKDKLFFVLGLSANNKEVLKQLPFSKYSEMVQVLAFRMNGFIDIVPDNEKPVEPLECLFQQTYGMGTANNVLIVFNKEKLLAANNLKIRVKEFGLNTGNMNFEFETKDIKEIQNVALK